MINPTLFELIQSGAIKLTSDKGQLIRSLKECTIMTKDIEFDITDLLNTEVLIQDDGQLRRNPFFFPEDVKGTFHELFTILPKCSNYKLAQQYYELALNDISHEEICKKRMDHLNNTNPTYHKNLEKWLMDCNWAQDDSVVAHADEIHPYSQQSTYDDSYVYNGNIKSN